MAGKPIGPAAHGASDCLFAATNAFAPSLLGQNGAARAICCGFAASQGLLNAPTDHPLGLEEVVPFRLHGEPEPYVPAILLLPWLTGATRQRSARYDFAGLFAVAAANSLPSDHNAFEPRAPLPTGQRLLAMAEAAVSGAGDGVPEAVRDRLQQRFPARRGANGDDAV